VVNAFLRRDRVAPAADRRSFREAAGDGQVDADRKVDRVGRGLDLVEQGLTLIGRARGRLAVGELVLRGLVVPCRRDVRGDRWPTGLSRKRRISCASAGSSAPAIAVSAAGSNTSMRNACAAAASTAASWASLSPAASSFWNSRRIFGPIEPSETRTCSRRPWAW